MEIRGVLSFEDLLSETRGDNPHTSTRQGWSIPTLNGDFQAWLWNAHQKVIPQYLGAVSY